MEQVGREQDGEKQDGMEQGKDGGNQGRIQDLSEGGGGKIF